MTFFDPSAAVRWRHRPDAVARWGVPAVTLVHLAIGVVLIDRLSLWGDEAFTAAAVGLPIGQLASMLRDIDVNMSAYYLMLDLWTSVFGHGEVALRLPSLLMTTATTFLGAHLVTRWFGAIAGLSAAVALGLSPHLLRVGLTARPFAMLGLLFVVATSLLVTALGRRDAVPWGVVALIDVLALYTSLLAVLFIAAQVVYVLVVDRRRSPAQVIAAAILAVGVIPSLLFIAPTDTLNWLDATNVPRVLLDVAGHRSGALFALLVVLGVVLWPRPISGALAASPRGRALFPVMLLAPLGLMVLLLPQQTLFLGPYLITTFVAAGMLAATVVGTLRAPLAIATIGVLAATSLYGIAVHVAPSPGFYEQDWRAATSVLAYHVRQGDAVVFPNTFYRIAGEYYAGDGGFTDLSDPVLPTTPWHGAIPYEYDRLKRTGQYLAPGLIVEALDQRNRVWLVGPEDSFMSFATDALVDAGWGVAETHDVSEVSVVLLVRE